MSTESASPASKTHRLNVRIENRQMAAAMVAAESAGTTVSEAVRQFLDALGEAGKDYGPSGRWAVIIEDLGSGWGGKPEGEVDDAYADRHDYVSFDAARWLA